MTKKHFIDLADRLRFLKPLPLDNGAEAEQKERHFGAMAQWKETVKDLAGFCASQNPNFDRERWLNYLNGLCGPSGGAIK